MLYKCSKESKDTEDEIGCIQGGVAIDTAVQWLRFRASIVEDLGSIPGWGTKVPHATWQTSPTTEALHSRGHALQLGKPLSGKTIEIPPATAKMQHSQKQTKKKDDRILPSCSSQSTSGDDTFVAYEEHNTRVRPQSEMWPTKHTSTRHPEPKNGQVLVVF